MVVSPRVGTVGASFIAAILLRWRSRAALWIAVGGLVAGLTSGLLVTERREDRMHGVGSANRVTGELIATSDVITGSFDDVVLARAVAVDTGSLPAADVALSGAGLTAVQVGDRVAVSGFYLPGVARFGRKEVVGRIVIRSATIIRDPSALHLRAANALRERVSSVLRPGSSPARALLSGFLIGETAQIPRADIDNMRRSGLSHFVAVSGSNVALFLLLFWLLLAPLGVSGWSRTVAGMAGLIVFAAMTRWEPSVIRAATAAGILMIARSAGFPLSGWSTLGVAASLVLMVAGEFATDVGFQLSVLAVIGVMGGSELISCKPKFVASGLSASIAAQLMVSPVLLAAFGSIPALSPLANVVAGPLVVAATSLAGVGVLSGVQPLVSLAAGGANGVLAIARVGAGWPQLDAIGFLAVGTLAVLLARFARRLLLPALILGVVAATWPASSRPAELPAVIFLDVGQGDSTLFLDDDLTVLVDGGPDPVRLERRLAEYSVRQIDVLIVSHVHADHILGLAAVIGRLPVGTIVADFSNHSTGAAEWLAAEARRFGVPIVVPEVGDRFGSGRLEFEIVGPLRRYASPNDESVVVRVDLAGLAILMSGDIETHAQRDIFEPGIDVLKVPHQGAATSELDWLARHAGRTSVVSVGPNAFGHPSDAVLAALRAADATIHRTDLDGDLVIGSG